MIEKKTVNKTELIDIVAKKSGMTKVETESLLTITLETIVETVAKGERVTLVGFGSFEARRSEEHSLNSSHTVISYAVFCLKKKK